MSRSSPLNGKALNSKVSPLVMSNPSPLNRSMSGFHIPVPCRLPFVVMSSHHLWTTNTLNLVILNRSCLLHHLWTDEYPISFFFIVTSSLSPLNEKISSLIIPNLSRPVSHLWTNELLDIPFFYPQQILFPRLILSWSRLVLVLVLIPSGILLGEISLLLKCFLKNLHVRVFLM